MDQGSLSPGKYASFPAELRAALARCEQTLGATGPLLRHLIADSESSLFHEEVLARVRGMLDSLAERLLRMFLDAAGAGPDERVPVASLDQLTAALADHAGLLAHVHALAIEWRLTRKLAERRSVEDVLSPLVQALVGSDDEDTASAAMKFLTAQARFIQYAKRMQLDPQELPAHLLHASLTVLRRTIGSKADSRRAVQLAIRHAQDSYDEATTRLGLAAALLSQGTRREQALDPGHAGLALFATALAGASDRSREQTLLAVTEGQAVRLALMLRAGGCDQQRAESVLLALYPEFSLPEGFAELDCHSASALLAGDTKPGRKA